jgi:bifunctional DNA-binding transcriptional regulator/antitoxin component of YhaV-PrlF toxin-antitoxin module
VTIPGEVLSALGVKSGDSLYIIYDKDSVRIVRAADDPIVALTEFAEREYEAGRTKSLREYMREKGIPDA